jgi:aspartate/methionine/tyrosine aminotransferase
MKADLGLGHIRLPVPLSPRVSQLGQQYGAPGGEEQLREAIAAFEGVTCQEVTVTTGASMGLTALLALLPRPASILLPRPCYPAYRSMAALLGIEAIFYDLREESQWAPDPHEILTLIRGDTRALLLNIPGNPVGNLASGPVLAELGRIAAAAGLLVISDEVYSAFLYSGAGAFPAVADLCGKQRTARVRSFSKSFGMPGARLGYVLSEPELAQRIARAHWALAMSPPSPAQAIALSLLAADPTGWLSRLRDELDSVRQSVAAILKGRVHLEFVCPAAGIFYWIKAPLCGCDSRQLARRCQAEAGVVVMAGEDFGVASPPCLRASFAVPRDEAERGFTALASFLEALGEGN